MAKVSNETRLVIHLFKARAKEKKENLEHGQGTKMKDWARGAIAGLNIAEEILAGITSELEHPK